jgi:AraC-like DNA-binding protein
MNATFAPPSAALSIGPSPAQLDLTPLYQRCVFRSAVRSRYHQSLRDSLNDHEVQWGAGDADAGMWSAATPRLQLMVLRYGSEVEIRPRPFEDFGLVQMPLRGSMQVEAAGARHEVGPGQVAVLSSRDPLTLRWSESCEQIIVRLPHSLLRIGASNLRSPGRAPGGQSVFVLADEAARQWGALLQSLLHTLPADEARGSPLRDPAWVHHLEDGMALFTTLHIRQRAREGALPEPGPAALASSAGSAARLQAAEHWVRTRLCAPLALEDLARAAGVSSRTFYMDCMRQMGVGPMAWLRDLRLDSARRELLADPARNITDVAIDCGFGHLGRFSAYYQRRFGELPRETVSRALR